MVDVSDVKAKTDLIKSTGIAMQYHVGGVIAENIADVIKIAELYARSGVMVPPHCRDKPGVCFALCQQAHEWGMPYLAVINKSYVVNNRGVERIAYESQLLHAVIEKNAPIKGRMRHEIIGEGDERRCKVWATFKGEEKPHEYLSETLGKLRDARGRNDTGQLKGSPLWDTQPDVQLFYSTSRQWARMFAPDVLLGAYTPEDPRYEEAPPPEPALLTRLREAKAHGDRGFDLAHVQREAGHTVIEGDAIPGATKQEEAKNGVEHEDGGRSDSVGGGSADNPPEGGGAEAVGGDPAVGGPAAGQAAPRADEAKAPAAKAGGRAPARKKGGGRLL